MTEGGKRIVPFKVPIMTSKLAKGDDSDEDSEEEARKKRPKQAEGTSLADLLPAPKRQTSGASKNKEATTTPKPPKPALGATKPAITTADGPASRISLAPTIPTPTLTPTPAPPKPIISAAPPTTSTTYTTNSNSLYSGVATDTGGHIEGEAAAGYVDPSAYPYNPYPYYYYPGPTQYGEPAPDTTATSRTPRPREFDLMGLEENVIEVDQSELRRNTFSAEFIAENSKRLAPPPSAGDGWRPSQGARRKHQITFLAFQAREKEQELLDRRAQSKRTISETRGKYGW
jgi:proline-rich protein PRCC